MLSSHVGKRCEDQLKREESTRRAVATERTGGTSMPAVMWQIGFINSKTCYLHMLVKDVKTNSNIRKALGG